MNVNYFYNTYDKSLFQNEKKINFWENYLQNLHDLDLNVFSEKLTVPVLVPIGSRILFQGELKHTNEVTVALGSDYFAKCSINQAEILKQHRVKDAQVKIELLKKEREYLLNQLSFSKQVMSDNTDHDIIEVVTEEQDKAWRKQHQENIKQYKQRKDRDDEVPIKELTDEELWNRLEELELQEEMENELIVDKNEEPTFKYQLNTSQPDVDNNSDDDDDDVNFDNTDKPQQGSKNNDAILENEIYLANFNRMRFFQQPSKLQLFEMVVDRHNALKKMVLDIRARERTVETEDDLMAQIDELEQLEKLEDEIATLEDMLASDEDDDIEEAKDEEDDNQLKKSVAFADEDDRETFELTFRHTDVEPCSAPYDPQKGITKPSDIRQAYSSCFNAEITSILKKKKYITPPEVLKTLPSEEKQELYIDSEKNSVNSNTTINSNTIVVKDVIEKVDCNDNSVKNNGRPISLFKKKRQQQKQ